MIETLNFNLNNRRSMYVSEGYLPLTSYFEGYFSAINDIQGENIGRLFFEFVKNELNKSFSVNVFEFIFIELAKENEIEAERLLLGYLSKFAEQKQ